jgi:hypothetical protein
MSDIKNSIQLTAQITALVGLILMIAPAVSFSRDNSLTAGLSVGLDYDDRSSDGSDDDDYRRLVLSPMVQFRSLSERDSFRLRAAPGIRYDLEESDTDWDSNLSVAVDRDMTEFWQMGISNNFLRSDSSDASDTRDTRDTVTTGFSDQAEPSEGDVEIAPSTTDPQLSGDRGRRRYWRNTLGLFSTHFYSEGSLFRMDTNYIALRNDDTGFRGDEDYDRYTAGLRNEHRYNAKWKSTTGVRYVLGDFEPSDDSAEDELSDDLQEYHLQLGLDNESILNNLLSVSYNYAATRFDETEQNDSDIHQMRFTWRRDISSRLYTKLGFGPSYQKTEGQDANWSENGIAEVNYELEYGFLNFLVEKSHSVDNFSGSDERGAVDSWETRLSGMHRLQKDLSLSGSLAYISEDREEFQETPSNGDESQITEFNRERYIAGARLSYNFWQYYTASVNYTFTTQDSERAGDDYDDHRILLTLSWQKELFHW